MTALALRHGLSRGTVTRGLAAGIAWGLGMSLALPVLGHADYGAICVPSLPAVSLCVSVGIGTIAPLAALFPRAD